jgi:hypothetical protein
MRATYQAALCGGSFTDSQGNVRSINRGADGLTFNQQPDVRRNALNAMKPRYCKTCGKQINRHDRGAYCSNACELAAPPTDV